MSAMSEAKKRANKKWNDANMKERYDRVQLVLPKGRKAELQAAAEQHGQSVNGFINSLIDESLEKDRQGTGVSAVAGGTCASVSADSPEGTDAQRAGVMVFPEGAPDDNSSSRLSSLTRPDSTTGQPDDEPEFIKVFKRLGAMSREEVDKQLGCDPEGMERYRQEMERKRQRLAELNAKAGGLSRAEDAERRRLMVECKSYPADGDSTQE